MNLVRVNEGGEFADRDAQMAPAAHPIAGNGHGLFPAQRELVIVLEDWRRDVLTQVFDFHLSRRFSQAPVKLKPLQGEQMFHRFDHGLPGRRECAGEASRFSKSLLRGWLTGPRFGSPPHGITTIPHFVHSLHHLPDACAPVPIAARSRK